MRDRTKHFETADEFIAYATERVVASATRRFSMTRWSFSSHRQYDADASGERRWVYQLYTGSWYGDVLYLPEEVGAALDAAWKRNHYNTAIGQRTFKGILKILDADEGLSKKVAEAKRQEKQRREVNLLQRQVAGVGDLVAEVLKREDYLGEDLAREVNALLIARQGEIAADLQRKVEQAVESGALELEVA